MRRSKRALALVTGALLLGLIGEAGASQFEFSPTIQFDLLDKKASANAPLRVVVKQENGEEELKTIELRVPPGFSLAVDQQLTAGEVLGAGSIIIDGGPKCRGLAGSVPANVPVNIVERNRTNAEIADNVQAVYVVDLQPVTKIDLLVKGSIQNGWRLEGLVPANQDTCPPFTFDATFRPRAEESGTPIFINPEFGGSYEFEAKFVGLNNSVSEQKQSVIIEGSAKPGESITKSCKGLKGKKKKRCKKKLRG